MAYYRTESPADVLITLQDYRDSLPDLTPSHRALLDRLIHREAELMPVWDSIARQRLSRPQCRALLEQIFFAAAFNAEHKPARGSKQQLLTRLSRTIAVQVLKFSELLSDQKQQATEHLCNDELKSLDERNVKLLDYLRNLFDGLEAARHGHWGLPAGFILADACLSALASVSLDDETPFFPEAVSYLREQLYEAGYPGVWDRSKNTQSLFAT